MAKRRIENLEARIAADRAKQILSDPLNATAFRARGADGSDAQ